MRTQVSGAGAHSPTFAKSRRGSSGRLQSSTLPAHKPTTALITIWGQNSAGARASSEWRFRQGATRTRQSCRRSRVQAPPSTTPHKITSQRTRILHVLPDIRLTPIRPARPSGRGRTACQIAVQDPACMQKRHARRDVTRDAEHGRQARAAGGVPSVFQKLARLDGSLRGRKREPRRTLTGAAAGAAARRSAGGRLSPGHTATRWQARMRCASEQPAPAHAPASAAYPAPCAQRRAG